MQIIRAERAGDEAAIAALLYQAFHNHPHHAPGSEPVEDGIVAALREQSALTLSLVAELDGELVGHLAVSPVTVAGQVCNWFGLGPVATGPAWQNQGIGSALMRRSIELMTEQGAAGLVVLGEPAFYQRFGFRARPGLSYPGVQAEYFMALALNGAPLPQGEVGYHPAFGG
ncbi:N-acetyltransferase [Neisseriaceae bacterium JH1-16]|nr:N-acetyltransferase [Neisseriaceae bacterium JH1-16]